MPIEQVRAFDEQPAQMFAFFNEHPSALSDLPALRADHPGLARLETWLGTTGWNAEHRERAGMTDGLLLPPGGGRRIQAMTLKSGAEQSKTFSTFEAEVARGFDVGAHLHRQAGEVFYVLDGELDLLAFQPATAGGDWRTWRSESGATVFRGGPGSHMFVPARCPHAFFNPGSEPARMLFLVSSAGHEIYLEELGELLAASGPPDQAEIAALRARHDIHQLTPLTIHPPGT